MSEKLRISEGKLENVVESGYGQSMHYDVKTLSYNAEKDCFEGRVWDGSFGPDDNTTWLEVPFSDVVERFGQDVAEGLKAI